MRRTLFLGLLLVLTARAQAPFDFYVVGCMPYGGEDSHAAYLRLAEDINAQAPAFTVHVGDTKSGSLPCDDAAYDRIATEFAAFRQPIFYSVGDNEWTDCHRPDCGNFDPLDRLELVRKRFFAREESLGQNPMPLTSQKHAPGFEKYVENTRWALGGVLFVGLHVVGSNNNLDPAVPAAEAEFLARDKANAAWLKGSFAEAAAQHAIALVLLIQANPFGEKGEPRGTGYTHFVAQLREETLRFGRPVLLMHADTHYFRIDKPLLDAAGHTIEDFTRVEVFGGQNLHAVQVHVDPAVPADPFTVRPRLIQANRHIPQK